MSRPEFSFGEGRFKINLKGEEAIRAGGWAIRCLLLARALAILVPTVGGIAVLLRRLF
jgi:hypothetical protein